MSSFLQKLLTDLASTATVAAAAAVLIKWWLERWSENEKTRRDHAFTLQQSERSNAWEKEKEERAHAFTKETEARQFALVAEREARERQQQMERQEVERTLVPRTQFDIRCDFYPAAGGKTIVDLRLIVDNKGGSIRGFESIAFDLYGMRGDTVPETACSRDGAQRLRLTDARISERIGYTFSVEPGVTQTFPLVTLIDADIRYVQTKVTLRTTKWDRGGSPEFTEQRFFPVILESMPAGA